MAILYLHHGDGKDDHNDKEVRGELVTALNGDSLTGNLTQDNVDSNDENHDKADGHTDIANAVYNFTYSVSNLFQGNSPFYIEF